MTQANNTSNKYEDDWELIEDAFKKMISFVKTKSFIDADSTSDADAIATLVSRYFRWSPQSVYECSSSMFEDVNCHTFNQEFEDLWYKEDQPYKKKKEGQPVATPTTQDVEVCF